MLTYLIGICRELQESFVCKPMNASVMWESIFTMNHIYSYVLKKPLGDCCELKLHLGGHVATAYIFSKGQYLLRHKDERGRNLPQFPKSS